MSARLEGRERDVRARHARRLSEQDAGRLACARAAPTPGRYTGGGLRSRRGVPAVYLFVDADACPVKDEVYVVADPLRRARRPRREPASARAAGLRRGARPRRRLAGRCGRLDRRARRGGRRRRDDRHPARRALPRRGRARPRHDRPPVHRGLDRRRPRGPRALSHLREVGVGSGGPRALSPKDRSRFASRLDEMVQRGLRESRD